MKHNPDNLSPETVGLGYRLLEEDEICDGPMLRQIELWIADGWCAGACGSAMELTYRTKLTPLALLCLREGLTLPTCPCHPEEKHMIAPTWLVWFMTLASAASLFFLIYLFFYGPK